MRHRLVLALLLACGTSAHAQVDTPEARKLLREAIAEAHRSVDCVVIYSNDFLVDASFNRMDVIAEEKFRAAGLTFRDAIEDRDAAFVPVYEALVEEGLIIDKKDGDVERFPSACGG